MKQVIHLLVTVAVMMAVAACSENDPLQSESSSKESLTIKVTDEHGVEISAEASVIRNNQTVSKLELSKGINRVPLSSSTGIMSILIEKDGYEPYRIDITQGNAKASASKIIHVILKSIFVFTLDTSEDDDTYVIDLIGTGSISIVWPDGTVEQGDMPLSFGHEFDKGANRTVILKGAISGIEAFHAFGYNTSITNLYGLKNMTSLEGFFPGNLNLSERLDLTHNRQLTSIDLFNATLPHWLKLPEQHSINAITISLADRNITSDEVGKLVANIYKNVVKENITGGTIALTGTDTPTAKTAQQIEILISNFGWSVNLNL